MTINTLDELQALFTEAVKITRQEKRMRAFVFRDKPEQLQAKLDECDRLEFILTTFKDELKATFPPSPEQQPLINLPPKYP